MVTILYFGTSDLSLSYVACTKQTANERRYKPPNTSPCIAVAQVPLSLYLLAI
jgi:hypothetical protein